MTPSVRRLAFSIVDVFTREPLSRNPLAVVANAHELDQTVMQRVAREFNLSETTFLLPPTRPDAHWRLRSFTQSGVEVFGAGHSALGAWWWRAESGQLASHAACSTFTQEIGERALPVEVRFYAEGIAAITMTQTPPMLPVLSRPCRPGRHSTRAVLQPYGRSVGGSGDRKRRRASCLLPRRAQRDRGRRGDRRRAGSRDGQAEPYRRAREWWGGSGFG